MDCGKQWIVAHCGILILRYLGSSLYRGRAVEQFSLQQFSLQYVISILPHEVYSYGNENAA